MEKAGKTTWLCSVCGYVHRGDAPPEACPVCGAGPGDFEPGPDSPPASRPEPGAPAAESPPAGRPGHVLVIGAGIAGVSAAEAAAESLPSARVTLVNGEPDPPYYRMNLTRFLAGEIGPEALALRPEAWYAERRIDRRDGVRMIRRIPGAPGAELSDGTRVTADAMILATGARPFVPPLPGADLPGVSCLRTLADARALLRGLRERPRCAVIGGGILGLETAGALARRGLTVTLIETQERLMPRQLNREAAGRLENHVGSLGIRVMKAARPAALEGDSSVRRLRLEGGGEVEVERVVLAAGVRPELSALGDAGLPLGRGIVVDSRLGCGPGLYAAGDVAEHGGVLYGTWGPAQSQGRMAGMNAAGRPAEFGGIPPSHLLKVLGVDLFSIGAIEPAGPGDCPVSEGTGGTFAQFVLRDGRLAGAILLGHPDWGAPVRRAVEAGAQILPAGSRPERVADVLRALSIES